MTLREILGDAYMDGMTVEEINKALKNITITLGTSDSNDFSNMQKEIDRLKAALAASKLATDELKNKLREKLSNEEKEKEIQEETLRTLKTTVETLQKEKELITAKSNFLSLGYDDVLASNAAQAMIDKNTEELFANQKKFLELREAKIKEELLRNSPTPPPGSPGDGLTKEQYQSLSLAEKQKLAIENPTVYAKFNKMEA